MARWMLFNLNGGRVEGRALMQAATLSEIQAPQVVARTDPSCPTPNAMYAMGWFVDTYNGHSRIAHGGYLHDINSEVMIFPADRIGIVFVHQLWFPGARQNDQPARVRSHHGPGNRTHPPETSSTNTKRKSRTIADASISVCRAKGTAPRILRVTTRTL